MTVFVVAHSMDDHAAPLAWALRSAGYNVHIWRGVGYGADRSACISFSSGSVSLELGGVPVKSNDVLWYRRPNTCDTDPAMDEADRPFAEGEARAFQRGLMHICDELGVRCINSFTAAFRFESKALQLSIANRVGFRIPDTLMTNEPHRVRAMIERHPANTICKAFLPHVWQKDKEEGCAINETFLLTAAALPEDSVIAYAPAIYQRKVDKHFDVRAVVMGDAIFSYALSTPNKVLDWRLESSFGRVTLREIDTPVEVSNHISTFMHASRLSFSIFDFAVDADGKWWFLEVNQQGQFVWLEAWNPSIGLLQKFAAFLSQGANMSRTELIERSSQFHSIADYEKHAGENHEPFYRETSVNFRSFEP